MMSHHRRQALPIRLPLFFSLLQYCQALALFYAGLHYPKETLFSHWHFYYQLPLFVLSLSLLFLRKKKMPTATQRTHTTIKAMPTAFMQSVPQLQEAKMVLDNSFLSMLVLQRLMKVYAEARKAKKAIRNRRKPIVLIEIPHLRGGNNEYYKLPSKCVNSEAIPLCAGKGI